MNFLDDSTTSKLRPRPGDELFVSDVQNDFLPDGALAVPLGDQVLSVLNRHADEFSRSGLPVVATRDWPPLNHCSFHAQGGRWQPHCKTFKGKATWTGRKQVFRESAPLLVLDTAERPYEVRISMSLSELAAQMDREMFEKRCSP